MLDVFSIDESKVQCQVLTVGNEGNAWRPVDTSNIEDASNFLSVDHGFCRDRSYIGTCITALITLIMALSNSMSGVRCLNS